MIYSDEIRLAFLVALNAAVLLAAWRFTRRWSADPVQRWTDTLLMWCAVQYGAVCIPGILHVLSPMTIGAAGLIIAAAMLWFAERGLGHGNLSITADPVEQSKPTPEKSGSSSGRICTVPASSVSSAIKAAAGATLDYRSGGAAEPTAWLGIPFDSAVFLAAAFFVISFAACVAYGQAYVPVVDSDAMTYHVPAAIHWLQTGRLALLPVWFFNPANTFSPLAGSAFIAWWIAPLGNDSLARAVQCPAVVLLFLATLQLGRAVGLPPVVAALTAAAVAVSRPFTSELMSGRDDIFLAAFIAVALSACGEKALVDRFAPWRLGLAVGLAAATKYTFFIAAPILLLVIDAPFKAGWNWRRWGAATLTALLIAGPWYARNWFLTGNPLYPLDINILGHRAVRGLFTALRSERLATWEGINRALIHGFHVHPLLVWVMLAGWAAALLGLKRDGLRQPLTRACLFGLPICLGLFLFKAPYGEVRFLFPALVPTFIAAAMGICRWPRRPWARILTASLLLDVAIGTSYSYKVLGVVAEFTAESIALTVLGLGVVWGNQQLGLWRRRVWGYAICLLVAGAGMGGYVYWKHYLEEYQAIRFKAWEGYYARSAAAWEFMTEKVPTDARVAYTNTYLIYPLYGPEFRRKLLYVPVRAEVSDFLHLPHFPAPLPGEEIEKNFTRLLNESADRQVWLGRILASGANFLFVDRTGPAGDGPELAFAEADPTHFRPMFRDAGAAIFEVKR